MDVTLSRRDWWIHAFVGSLVAVIVLVGFSRTYYLKAWFETPALTTRLHVHGLLMTLWIGLFLVQTGLIARHRRRIHQTLGVGGVILAALATAATCAAALEAAHLNGARGGIAATDRLYSSLVLVALFFFFVAAGALFRKRRQVHKRLMLLAMITVVGPGAARAVTLIAGRGVRDGHIPVMAALVLAGVAYDWWTRGRPHWALVVGGAVLIVSQLTRRVVGGSELWTAIGGYLIG